MVRQVQYLGTAERAPQIICTPGHTPYFSDLGGMAFPIDEFFGGETGVVSALLSRWNEKTVQRIRSLPHAAATTRPGSHPFKLIGEMSALENSTFPLYVVFPYSNGKAAMEGMPAGYRFWAAKNIGPFQITPGTRAMKKQMIFGCSRFWKIKAIATPLRGPSLDRQVANWDTTTLYDFDISETDAVPLD